MTDLERRALLGNQQAQEECTRLGIVLPCPKCYGSVYIESTENRRDLFSVTFACVKCGLKYKVTQERVYSNKDYIPLTQNPFAQWNTRPAPPIGRCGECSNACKPGDNIVTCGIFERDMMPDDFCSQFEPKGEK